MTGAEFHKPIWDRGEPIDAEMLAFTVGDDPLWDRRLVPHDIRGSLAHAAGLLRAGLIDVMVELFTKGGRSVFAVTKVVVEASRYTRSNQVEPTVRVFVEPKPFV